MKDISNNCRRKQLDIPGLCLVSMICFLGITSCSKNPEYAHPSESKLVIQAEITAGDSVKLSLTRSIAAGTGSSFQFEKIYNAEVQISSSDGAEWHLNPNYSPRFNDVPGAIYSNPGKLKPSISYSLRVDHPTLGTVSSSTHIPAAFLVNDYAVGGSTFGSLNTYKVSFNIKDNPAEKDFYILEVLKQPVKLYRYFYWQGVQYDYDSPEGMTLHEKIEDEEDIDLPVTTDTVTSDKLIRIGVFTEDQKTDNHIIGNVDSSFNRIFIRDTEFDGESYATSIHIPSGQILSADPKEIGKLIIQVKSVDSAFYNYMLEYEKYKSDFRKMPVSQLESPTGNIKNGLGIFGGVYKNEKTFYYDELD